MISDSDSNFDSASAHLAQLCAGANLPTEVDRINWQMIIERAVQHRVVPLLYSQLRRQSDLAVPDETLAVLRRYVQNNAARALALAGQMRKLLESFAQAQIRVIVFKGIALSAALYDDVSMREVGDLDLLVNHNDIVRAADLLLASGHEPFFPTATPRESAYLSALQSGARRSYLQSHCEHHLVHPASRLNVDLHWAFSLREFAVSLDPNALWSRAVNQSVAGFNVQTPGSADMLLILCLNGGKDRWERLDRICDIAALMRRLPESAWPTVFDLATQAGMARMLAIGVLLAKLILKVPIPDEVANRLTRDNRAVKIAEQVLRRLLSTEAAESSPKALGFRFDLQMRERFRDRLRYVGNHFRPGVGDWAAVPLPPSLAPLHYIIRPFRLMTRYGLS